MTDEGVSVWICSSGRQAQRGQVDSDEQPVGTKVAIVSDKPQTTRNRIRCILTRPDAQIVFLDTWYSNPLYKLGEYMVQTALKTLNGGCRRIVVDASTTPGRGDEFVAAQLKNSASPVILAANKVDLWESRGERGPS